MPHNSEWDRLVNDKWPSGMPIPSDKEAIAGAKRLYRRAMGRPFRGKVVVTSGNRYTWIRRGVMHVNPNRRRGSSQAGWPDIVHLLSHCCHARNRPNERSHSHRQLDLEADLTSYAIKHGFHEGRLARPVKPAKPKPDRQTVAYQRSVAALARWNTKLKRAQTGLKKHQAKVRRYEKVLAIR